MAGPALPVGVSMTLQGISNPILQVEAGWKRAFMLAHYVPWLLWPVGLGVAIAGFALRWRGDRVQAVCRG